MTLTGIRWDNIAGRDIHLLPGLVSPRLDQLLKLDDSSKTVFTASQPPAGVAVTFRPSFVGQPSNFGVTVDAGTGQVTVRSALPPNQPRLRSFRLEATVTEPGEPDLNISIRVYVHQSMTAMWVSPDPMTVRSGSKGMRFSVMALFDDGVVCDITNWSPFTRPNAGELTFVHVDTETDPIHRWSSNSSGITVDPVTGELSSTLSAPDQFARITVQRGPSPPGGQGPTEAFGVAFGGPPWNKPIVATVVAGPGYKVMTDPGVHNVLFLPEGFTAAEQPLFRAIVGDIVTKITSDPSALPFSRITKYINYFRVWVPSRDSGVMVLPELNVTGLGATGLTVENLPMPGPPTAADELLSVTELIAIVGLPTPRYEPDGTPLDNPDPTVGLLPYWQQVYRSTLTETRTIDAFPDWLDLNDRLLANDLDTAFHLAIGTRPTLDAEQSDHAVKFHPLRGTDDNLDAMLRALTDDGSVSGTPQTLSPPVWVKGGNDQTLLVFVCRGAKFGGSNNYRNDVARYIGMTLAENDETRVRKAGVGRWGFDLVPDALSPTASVDTWTTVLHEVAHSFRLADEYGGGDALPLDRAARLKTKFNAQHRDDLTDADGKHLDMRHLKWRWRRLLKAGVMIRDLSEPSPGPFTVTLQAGHAAQFRVNEVVRFRARSTMNPGYSDRLTVTRKIGTNQVVVTPMDGSDVDPNDWGEGSLLVRPVRADEPREPNDDPGPPPDSLGDDLELVAKLVIDRINLTHNPLNRKPSDDQDTVGHKKLTPPTGATNFRSVDKPDPPTYSAFIIGVYENADEYNYPLYHPSGICFMNRRHYTDDGPPAKEVAYAFCHVCRYALVDQIDPILHSVIEREYQKIYPAKPKPRTP